MWNLQNFVPPPGTAISTTPPSVTPTEYYFLVILPNRSVSELAQTTIGELETQLGSEITQLNTDANNNAYDWEMSYFRDVILRTRAVGFRKKTIEELEILFSRYRYNYNFNRRNIADLFSVSENGASGFIKKCLKRGIIYKIRMDEYCFKLEQDSN